MEPHQTAATGGDEEEVVARESSKDEVAENQPSEKRKKLVSSEVAADLGNRSLLLTALENLRSLAARWKSHEAEPRQVLVGFKQELLLTAPFLSLPPSSPVFLLLLLASPPRIASS